MKKKVVVELPLCSEKARRNALKLAVQASGVLSATIEREKNQLTVIGEGMDAVSLVQVIRNGGCCPNLLVRILGCGLQYRRVLDAVMVSLEDVKEEEKKKEEKKEENKEEKKEENKEEKKDNCACVNPCTTPCCWYPHHNVFQVMEVPEPNVCRVM